MVKTHIKKNVMLQSFNSETKLFPAATTNSMLLVNSLKLNVKVIKMVSH